MTIEYQVSKVNNITFIKSYDYIQSPPQPLITLLQSDLSSTLSYISTLSGDLNLYIDATNPIFDDINFKIDNTKVKINSETIKQDVMSGATLGASNMLDAINEQKFAVILGRKTANLKNNINQNHDCIDALVSNGLMGSPKIMSEYSVGKILLELSNNKNITSMNFYISHPSLRVNVLSGHGISTYNVPRYEIGSGEILSVFFRYIALIFFPYMVVNSNSEDIDYKYDL